jgi:hypothetical protein
LLRLRPYRLVVRGEAWPMASCRPRRLAPASRFKYVAKGEAIARLCRAAGADPEAIGGWTEEGRRRARGGRPQTRTALSSRR